MKRDRQALGRTFERSAEFYDEVRPGYPEALFDDLERLSEVPSGGRILEIGCGTGKATLPLARRGYRVLCLEPGASLAAIARRNLAAFPAVEVRTSTFEDWKVEHDAFDLVVAATSFHWLDPDVRYRKSAEALRTGGCAAVFWNAHVQLPGQDRFFEVVQEAYRRHAPEIVGASAKPEDLPTMADRVFLDTGWFEVIGARHYSWSETYDTARYLKLLQTFSDHLALPGPTLRRLLRDIGELIDQEFGGQVAKHVIAVLQIARKLG